MSDSVAANCPLANPESIDECVELLHQHSLILAVGNQTKPPLSFGTGAALVAMSQYSGIVQYEPSEFTFTARAGTTLAEIEEVLASKQQYLPFDPLLGGAGATIAGTVSAGLSGPGRFRYGGIRDFLLGVQFLSGDAKLIHSGGKVVKNAAGFDLPKFLIGGLGRFGLITELTFKVFPFPSYAQTLCLSCTSHESALQRMSEAAGARWELDAIDYRPDQRTIYLRLRGPETAVQTIVEDIRSRWGRDLTVWESEEQFWNQVSDLNWCDHAFAMKVPTTPTQAIELWRVLDGRGSMHCSAACNVAWILAESRQAVDRIDEQLSQYGMAGMVLRGELPSAFLGRWPDYKVGRAIKEAMDPSGKFPDLNVRA